RHRALALLLSELGAYLAGPEHAPAGTKRLANLLHSPRWEADVIARYLLAQGGAQVGAEAARVPEGRALCILDTSVAEKPESGRGRGGGRACPGGAGAGRGGGAAPARSKGRATIGGSRGRPWWSRAGSGWRCW